MFASALITQMVQTAACNRHHPVDQQLCRWMLLSLDRLPSSRISMTEQLIGNMLGLDRAAVEKRSCECYAAVKKESARLLPLSVRVGR